MSRKSTIVNLPRERNIVRVRSVFARSVRKAANATKAYRENPNAGTAANRADRVLAARAQSFRVAFVRAYNRSDIHGIVRTSHVRKAARLYREALKAWANGYDTSNGWDAARRTAHNIALTVTETVK